MAHTFADEIIKGFSTPRGNRAWFHMPTFNAYMRLGPRIFDGQFYSRTLTLADVTVHEKRRGIFTQVLTDMETAARAMGAAGVMVENIINPVVRHTLEKRGYLTDRDRDDAGYSTMFLPFAGLR